MNAPSTDLDNVVTETRQHHQAVIDNASMTDLVACGRLYYAAINTRGSSDISDDEFSTLTTFDDVLSEIIAQRRPTSPEEFAAKTEYLLGRIQADNMSDDACEAALAAVRQDAAAISTVGFPLPEPAS